MIRYLQRPKLFNEAERTALRIARDGATQSVSDADFKALKTFYNEREVLEIIAVISLFGFLNRWNDTMATTLEDEPKSFATNSLSASGWKVGKHENQPE